VERLIGRADGARLTIDHLQFDLSDDDCVRLAAQLLPLLNRAARGAQATIRRVVDEQARREGEP